MPGDAVDVSSGRRGRRGRRGQRGKTDLPSVATDGALHERGHRFVGGARLLLVVGALAALAPSALELAGLQRRWARSAALPHSDRRVCACANQPHRSRSRSAWPPSRPWCSSSCAPRSLDAFVPAPAPAHDRDDDDDDVATRPRHEATEARTGPSPPLPLRPFPGPCPPQLRPQHATYDAAHGTEGDRGQLAADDPPAEVGVVGVAQVGHERADLVLVRRRPPIAVRQHERLCAPASGRAHRLGQGGARGVGEGRGWGGGRGWAPYVLRWPERRSRQCRLRPLRTPPAPARRAPVSRAHQVVSQSRTMYHRPRRRWGC